MRAKISRVWPVMFPEANEGQPAGETKRDGDDFVEDNATRIRLLQGLFRFPAQPD